MWENSKIMKLVYNKEINIEVGQEFYGIIAVTSRTYDGIYPVKVDDIDWNNEEVIFKIDQPCGYVSCYFIEFNKYVFNSEKEAEEAIQKLEFGEGMFEWQ